MLIISLSGPSSSQFTIEYLLRGAITPALPAMVTALPAMPPGSLLVLFGISAMAPLWL